MSSFGHRLTARLKKDGDNLRPSQIPDENIASPESLKKLRREISAKVDANQAVMTHSQIEDTHL